MIGVEKILTKIVEDTTPQLGGALDCQENNIDNVGDIIHDDATASDWTLKNEDQDKDIIFNGNDGGADTVIMKLDVSEGQLSGMLKAVSGVLTPATAGTDYFRPIISSNTTLTVKASGGDYTTVQGALDYLAGYLIAANIFVTIEVDDGVFTSSSTITMSHINGDRIKITGKNTYTTTISSIQSVGSAAQDATTTNYYFDYILNVASVSNIVAGDFVTIPAPTGGTNPYLIRGSGEVQSVDTGNNRITVRFFNNYTAATASGAVSDTITIIKSVLFMTGSAPAITVESKTGEILNIAIKGAYLSSGIYGGSGILLRTGTNLVLSRFIQGINISGGDIYNKDIFGSNCSSAVNTGNGARLIQNGTCGIWANGCVIRGLNILGGFCRIAKLYVVGCSGEGVFISWGGSIYVGSGAAANVDIQRCNYGIYVEERSYAGVLVCNIVNNTTADVYAHGVSYVNVVGGTTGTESPTVNTVGNDNAYIKQ